MNKCMLLIVAGVLLAGIVIGMTNRTEPEISSGGIIIDSKAGVTGRVLP